MLNPGDIIEGKYRLVREIGRGGMASVWEAEHVRLGSRVAVKLIGGHHPFLGTMRERFNEEARLAAAVRHRNIVEILDFGSTDDGLLYMVMELLSGKTLGDLIEQEAPMEPAEVVSLGRQILGALAAVHEHGIVHRDLKPDNVLFAEDIDGRFVKLVDFGISKNLLGEAGDEKRPKTQDGLLLGTPQYMSPEQARGVKDLDQRSDLYAVGVLLYEMLAGVRPYEDERMGELLLKVVEGNATPVRMRRPEIPEALAAVVERAMASDREARFADALEMRKALARSLRPSAAPPEAVDYAERSRMPTLAVNVPAPATTGGAPAAAGTASEAAASTGEAWPHGDPPRSVELPDPEPMRLPSAGARRRRAFLWLLLVVAIAAVPEIDSPGFYQHWFARGREVLGLPPVDTRVASPPDEGEADAGPIHVRLSDVPGGARIILDGETFRPRAVDAMRTADGTVDLPVPRRPGPFDLRVRVRGRRDFHVRRWTIRDFDFHVRFPRARRRR